MVSYLPVAKAIEKVQNEGYQKIVCGGFSAGCDMLLRTILFSSARCDRLILQSPWIPVMEDHVADLVHAIQQKNQDFTKVFGAVSKQQTEYYGACTSIRVWYKDGKEVEFGIVESSWISMPLDAGTYQVLSDGYKVIVDKKRYFKNLKLQESGL